MNIETIKSMFTGVSEYNKSIIVHALRPQLTIALDAVNKSLLRAGKTSADLSPQPNLIMNAFRLCDLQQLRVVILGQDPYIKVGEAMGCSFSVPKGIPVPPSLRNIYSCLKHHGYIQDTPTHGDLSSWARQGVLLINAAFTTVLGKSNEHAQCWLDYTNALLSYINDNMSGVSFILLGGVAQRKSSIINAQKHQVLEWGHPSPLNAANQTDNAKNFKYCDVFVRANNALVAAGLPPIDWNPDSANPAPIVRLQLAPAAEKPISQHMESVNPPEPHTLWLFTDGGSRANGKVNCAASWGVYMTDGVHTVSGYGIVKSTHIQGAVYSASSNRGELTAMQMGAEYIQDNPGLFNYTNIIVVSDSEYSINCINKWAAAWIADPVKHKIGEKKNMDIIIPTKNIIDMLRKKTPVKFIHVKSHKSPPLTTELTEWFMWKCNDIVDHLCGIALGR